MPKTHTKDLRAFRQSVKRGKSLTESKLAAGYSYSVARVGTSQLPKAFKAVWHREQAKFQALAASHTPEQQESAVRGALLANLYEGKDRAVQSAKLLGQDKRVNMFTADNQVGVIVLQPPAGLLTELQQRIQSAPDPLMIGDGTNTSDTVPPSD